jgi:hypothetical protein
MAKCTNFGRRAYKDTLPPLPSLVGMPPQQRLLNHTAMAFEYRDPDDRNVQHRTARTVSGYRAYCPLRRRLRHYKERSGVTIEMILAADELRRLADAVAIGLSGNKNRFNMIFAEMAARPRSGPAWHEILEARAGRAFRRAMALFDAGEKELVTYVVLLNRTLTSYAGVLQGRGIKATAEKLKQPLVRCLNKLVEHFGGEVDQALQRGEMV